MGHYEGTSQLKDIYGLHVGVQLVMMTVDMWYWPQALEIRTPLFPHLVPPAIMVWIFVWKYIFEPFIHMLQHFMLQLSRSNNFSF
jgi:hypothetical protein